MRQEGQSCLAAVVQAARWRLPSWRADLEAVCVGLQLEEQIAHITAGQE